MKPFKILLIDANGKWISKHKKIAEQVVLPIGLMYLSSYIKEHLEHPVDIKLLNTLIDLNDISDIRQEIKHFEPDLIAVRVLSANFDYFRDLISEFPNNLKVVVGGPHVNLDPLAVINHPKIDFIILNEGEETLLELISSLIKNEDVSEIKGLGFKKGSKPIINPRRSFIEELDSLPFPDYSLIDLDKYSNFLNYGYTLRRQGVLLTSRGCPFNCHYCFNFYGRKFRKRSAANVFREIKHLYEVYKIKDFFIVDDTFNIDKQRCVSLFRLIIDSGLKIRLYFTSGLRGDLMDKEYIDLMVEAGTIWVTFGVETVNKRVQKLANRIMDVDKLKQSIEYCCEKGIMVATFFIVGFPTETKDEAMETLNFIKKLNKITMPYMFGMKFFPGTKLYELAEKMEIIDANQKENIFKPYHEISAHKTDALSEKNFQELFIVYMKDIFLNKNRLCNAIKTQRKYLSEQEVNTLYSVFLKRKIVSPEKAFNL